MNHTSRLNLPLIHSGQAQKEITHNEALTKLDMLINPVVKEINIKRLADNAESGELFIIAANPDNELKDHANELALKLDNGWRFSMPTKWLEASLDQDGSKYCWNGEKWIKSLPSSNNADQLSDIGNKEHKEYKVESAYIPESKPTEAKKKIIQNDLLINKENGEYLKIGHLEEKLVLEGSHTNTKIKIPHHTILIAVNVRVIEKITGTNKFHIGIANDPVRYGNNLGPELDTTNIGLSNHLSTYWNDTAIRVSTAKGSFTSGKLHITIQYLKPHGPWNWD